jgi:hypothetical protein
VGGMSLENRETFRPYGNKYNFMKEKIRTSFSSLKK